MQPLRGRGSEVSGHGAGQDRPWAVPRRGGDCVKPDKPEAPAPGDLTASPGCASARGTGPS